MERRLEDSVALAVIHQEVTVKSHGVRLLSPEFYHLFASIGDVMYALCVIL